MKDFNTQVVNFCSLPLEENSEIKNHTILICLAWNYSGTKKYKGNGEFTKQDMEVLYEEYIW